MDTKKCAVLPGSLDTLPSGVNGQADFLVAAPCCHLLCLLLCQDIYPGFQILVPSYCVDVLLPSSQNLHHMFSGPGNLAIDDLPAPRSATAFQVRLAVS